MKRVSINNLGEHGIIRDVLAHQLPPNAWSSGVNVIMRDGAVQSRKGRTAVLGTPSVPPSHIRNLRTTTGNVWVYSGYDSGAGDDALYSTDGTTHTDRSGASYTSGQRWNSTELTGIVVFNNGVEDPQYWNGAAASFADLSNWPASTSCKVMRSHRNFLFALDVTESGTRYPQMVRWSDAADTGSLPGSWDYSDATTLSGRTELSEHGGHILDALTLGGDLYIYKETAVYLAQYIGGIYVFRFSPRFSDIGIMGTDCVVDLGGRHAVMTSNDLVTHDGGSWKSLIDGREKRWFQSSVDRDNREACFVAHNHARGEAWFCWPERGQTYANMGYVHDYRTGESGIIELPGVSGAATGDLPDTSGIINNDTRVIDNAYTLIDEALGTANRHEMVLADTTNTEIISPDYGYSDDGDPITSSIGRQDVILPGFEAGVKTITNVYPRVETVGNTSVQVYIGSKFNLQDSVTWSGPYAFNPATDHKVDCRVTGRYFSHRYVFNTLGGFKLSGVDFDVTQTGAR